MKLLWHFIKKDLAALRWWMLAWAGVCIAHLVLRLVQLNAGNGALPERFVSTGRPDHLLLLLLVVLIVPQVIQLDSPTRGAAFWRTVPLSKWRVFLAKTLLIGGVFVVFPLALEATYFLTAGFGALTWTALGMWLLRMLPVILIMAGAASLARDIRIAALLVGAAGVVIYQSSALAQVVGAPDWVSEMSPPLYPWTNATTCWLAAIGALLVPAQYLLLGRFGWIVAALLLAVTWPKRAEFAPFLRAETPAKSPSIEAPAGMRIEPDPLPGFLRFETTKRSGEIMQPGVRLSISGVPPDLSLASIELVEPRLVLPDRTLAPATPAETENRGSVTPPRGPSTLAELSRWEQGGRWFLEAPFFRIDQPTIEQAGYTYLEARVRARLVRLRAVTSAPVEPGVVWRAGLHQLRLDVVRHAQQPEKPLWTTLPRNSLLRRDDPSEGMRGLQLRGELAVALADQDARAASAPVRDGARLQFLLRHEELGREELITTVQASGSSLTMSSRSSQELTVTARLLADITRSRHWREFTMDLPYENSRHVSSRRGSAYEEHQLRERLGAPEHWRLRVEAVEPVGEFEVPIRIGPLLPPRWRNPEEKNQERALGAALAKITLSDAADAAQVDAYLHRLFLLVSLAPEKAVEFQRNTVLLKLAAVGAENLEALLRWAENLSAPEGGGGFRIGASVENPRPNRASGAPLPKLIRRVICDLARPEDKERIIGSLAPHLDFVDAVEEHGWHADALPRLAEWTAKERVPERWMDFLSVHGGEPEFRALIAQFAMENANPNALQFAARQPGFPERDAIEAAWLSTLRKRTDTTKRLRFFARACGVGLASVPRDLLFLLQLEEDGWRGGEQVQKEEVTHAKAALVQVFAKYSDAPRDPVAAIGWLAPKADSLQFNPATRRYEMP